MESQHIRFNPEKAPIPANFIPYFPIDSAKQKEFFGKLRINVIHFKESYQNLLFQLNELSTEILAQSILGNDEINIVSKPRNIELYKEGNQFIEAMIGSNNHNLPDFYHWLMDEATRPLLETEDRENGLVNLSDFFKIYENELKTLESYFDPSASLVQRASLCWFLRHKNMIIAPYSTGSASDKLEKILVSLGIVGNPSLGVYNQETTRIEVGINSVKRRNFLIRAATKGTFLGAAIATGGSAIPISICAVSIAAFTDVTLHKRSNKIAKERGKHIAVHETVHELGSSLSQNADTWSAKCGFLPYSNPKKSK